MKSPLFANTETVSEDRFALQNHKMLKVRVTPEAGVVALKGSMVAYQGQAQFHHKGAGGVGKFLKKHLTGEDVPLMEVTGDAEVFFAVQAKNVFLLQLEGDGITVNGENLLAFDPALTQDISRVQGAGALTGGLFNTTLTGHGTVALVSDGAPVILDTTQTPTYVDMQAAIAWSSATKPTVQSSMNVRSLVRGGSGEAMQYAFTTPGWVAVQPSEGIPVPTA